MSRSLERSNAHFRKAVSVLPLGVSSNFRYWGEDKTIYVDHGRGGRITDIDGNEYVDYRMGYGPGILGYADPRVDAAARAGMETGGVFALSTEKEWFKVCIKRVSLGAGPRRQGERTGIGALVWCTLKQSEYYLQSLSFLPSDATANPVSN